jgi:hypothetical protein
MMNETLQKLDNGTYKNTKEIGMGEYSFSARDLLIKAPILAGLNVYLVGGTGEGKTQLAHDLANYFGDSYCYTIGRPDFEPSELLKEVRLDKLKEAKSDLELTQNINKILFYCDELNRATPIVQNYLFDFFDGKIIHKGKILPLGRQGYHLGYATGNVGNGAYVGISDSDRALKDRMHMIVKLDYPDYETTELDDLKIFKGKKDPRATMPEHDLDCLDNIIEMHNEFVEREVPAILPLLGVYFTKGLDHLENTTKHSKRAVDKRWPRVEGIREDTDERLIFPLSKRAVFGAIALSQALEMIAESNGYEINNSVDLFLDSLRLTVPYSGVLAEDFVNNDHDEDVYTAFDAVMENNREGINNKLGLLEEGLALAEAGVKDPDLLSEIGSEGRWMPVRNALSMYADDVQENPREEGIKIKEILKESKNESTN